MTDLRNLLILLARVGLGVVFLAHGWQKFVTNGLDATQRGFESMGAPLPGISAILAAAIELAGGAGLILGVITPAWAVLLFADMVGAYLITHMGNGLFVNSGGSELVIGLGAGALLLLCTGAGRFSVDGLLGGRVPWNRGGLVPA
ncbi:DoxX family protein [Nocardia rhamnosiphila]|uniref:DoxX family protein n=1 Tax=Nocardia rhamnosiphila TaxID=426716 RepID=UPI0004C44C67|nr:DoxX family protein [Nocardia rhamnosiphila]